MSKYISSCKTHIFPSIGNKRLLELTLLDCQKTINSIEVKDSTHVVENAYIITNMALDKTVAAQYIKFNPMQEISLPKRKAIKTAALTINEQKYLLQKVEILEKIWIG